MARSSQLVQIGKRKLELSNLNKVLFPAGKVLKAEVIQYYLAIAPTVLSHIKNRPLSLVRFPDGIEGEKFFQKNRPEWAPDWVEYVTLGSEQKDYILATEEATLAWLSNLACIELHQVQAHRPHFDKPDYFVFDLDPPEQFDFRNVIEIALNLKEHIERFGYNVLAKTTGGKGIHLVLPIEPKWSYDEVFEAAQQIAKPFVEKYPAAATLHLKKEARKGRLLLDIFRNRSGQTIVCPYSLRGKPGAPVSMPLGWDTLMNVKNSIEWNIKTAIEKVKSEGDAWEGFASYAVELHTKRKIISIKPKALKQSGKFKTPEQLETYSKKRDFEKTPEPAPQPLSVSGNGFVVHRHHASHLHYDLRLEKDGTLKSWAVPKGIPSTPGVKRLAVQTEDHPMEYLHFEGTIPKGQYGGGDMWVFASGKYEITKLKKDDSIYFKLSSKELNGEFRMYPIKKDKKEWLLERLDKPQIDWLHDLIEPMLADTKNAVPEGDKFIYEVKWDGIRAMISLDEGKLTIRSRSQRDITHLFPELNIPEKAFHAACGLFDTEIVCLEVNGKPNFKTTINRLMQSTPGGIERGSLKHPAFCYVFDCLYLDGRALINEPLMRRREWMTDAIRKDSAYRASEAISDGSALFAAAQQHGLEGIMAKVKDSKYFPGKRTSNWIKIKVRSTADCFIIGYTKGKGDREVLFGALHLGEFMNGAWQYRGKVGTGFDSETMQNIFLQLKEMKTIKRPVQERPVDENTTTWIEPKLVCEIQYSSITENYTYREPVFLRMREDLTG